MIFIFDYLNQILKIIAEAGILLFEYVGVIILVITCIKGIIDYIKKDKFTYLNLAKGMAMGLEFKLGSEILRTVIVREFKEILIVAGIIILRAALTFLIHWEIKNEEKNCSTEDNNKNDKNDENLVLVKQGKKLKDKV